MNKVWCAAIGMWRSLSTDWLAAVAANGSVIDLAPWIQQSPPHGFPEAWTESLLRMQKIDGKILGLPYHDGPECLIWRKDLLKISPEQTKYKQQFGAALHPLDTWIEFQQVARFFQRPEEGIYGTVLAAYPDGHNTVYDFLLQLWTRGGELFGISRTVRFETDQIIEALQFYRSMLQDSAAVHPQCRNMDSVESGRAFARGEVAMMVNWFGFAAVAEKNFAEVRSDRSVSIAPVPRAPEGRHISLNAYWVLVLATGTVS
jgi:multiple sugar transport system substrate-binding protein